jgi:hypothetical protein
VVVAALRPVNVPKGRLVPLTPGANVNVLLLTPFGMPSRTQCAAVMTMFAATSVPVQYESRQLLVGRL